MQVMPGVSTGGQRAPMVVKKKQTLSIDDHVQGVLANNRTILGRTFSLLESSLPDHRRKAVEILDRLAPRTGGSIRLGITGVPGVGKSTFIESLGAKLLAMQKRVAVLAVDPSSSISGGSILGDKTRMELLSRDPRALVRPTPAGTWLGGVARGTRESILLCEAAGFDVVIVETVGVGQSETQVASMVDFFLLLMLAGAGDELQGIKRGIIEMSDAIAINKADGDNRQRAIAAKAEYAAALRLLRPPEQDWKPRVLTCSATERTGIDTVWETIEEHRRLMEESGRLEEKRQDQVVFWMRQTIEHLLVDRFYANEAVKAKLEQTRIDVVEGRLSPFVAAEKLLEAARGTG